MGPALKLILVFYTVFFHLGGDNLPGLAVDGEVEKELLVKVAVPEIFALAFVSDCFGLFYLLLLLRYSSSFPLVWYLLLFLG